MRLLLIVILFATGASASLRHGAFWPRLMEPGKRSTYDGRSTSASEDERPLKRPHQSKSPTFLKIPEDPSLPLPPGPLDQDTSENTTVNYLDLQFWEKRFADNFSKKVRGIISLQVKKLKNIPNVEVFKAQRMTNSLVNGINAYLYGKTGSCVNDNISQSASNASTLLKLLLKRTDLPVENQVYGMALLSMLYRTNATEEERKKIKPIDHSRKILEHCLAIKGLPQFMKPYVLYEYAKVEEAAADENATSYETSIELCKQVLEFDNCPDSLSEKAHDLLKDLIRR